MIAGKAEALSSESLATKRDVDDVRRDLHLLKWMVGFNLAFSMAVLWKIVG